MRMARKCPKLNTYYEYFCYCIGETDTYEGMYGKTLTGCRAAICAWMLANVYEGVREKL